MYVVLFAIKSRSECPEILGNADQRFLVSPGIPRHVDILAPVVQIGNCGEQLCFVVADAVLNHGLVQKIVIIAANKERNEAR